MVIFFFSCYFFRFGRNFHFKMSSLEEWRAIVLSAGSFFGRFLHFFSLILKARSTLLCRFLTTTSPPAMFPGVFRPCRCKLWSWRLSVIGAWKLSALWCTWEPRSAFFWPCSTASDFTASAICLGGPSGSACPSRAAVRPVGSSPSGGSFVLDVFCLCVLSVSLLFLRS